MINFRYHIVSLMAVFLALSVGIAVGVSLGTPVDEGLVAQADQDRKQVTDLRAELDRRNALDQYRETYDQRVGTYSTGSLLSGERVATVAMPGAPNGVVQAVATAVQASGGTIVRSVKVNADAFDPTKADAVDKMLDGLPGLALDATMSQGAKVGTALARSIAARGVEDRDADALTIGKALSGGGLVSISGDTPVQAQLVLVVTAEATDPKTDAGLLAAHVQFDLALKGRAGVVLAGPNSADVSNTDVLTARSDATADGKLSTVDVADLNSGVTTVILAGKEQLLGGQGSYGALAKADAPLPDLPVR